MGTNIYKGECKGVVMQLTYNFDLSLMENNKGITISYCDWTQPGNILLTLQRYSVDNNKNLLINKKHKLKLLNGELFFKGNNIIKESKDVYGVYPDESFFDVIRESYEMDVRPIE